MSLLLSVLKTAYHMHANKFGIICTRKLCFICTPNTFVSYIRQSPFFFVSIPRVFIFIWHTIYTHFHEHFRAHIYLKGVIHLFQHSLMKRKLETTAFIFFRNRNRKNVFIVTFDQLIMSLLNKSINKIKKVLIKKLILQSQTFETVAYIHFLIRNFMNFRQVIECRLKNLKKNQHLRMLFILRAFLTKYWCMQLIIIKVINVTRAGRMSRNAHGLILSYRQKKWKMSVLVIFEVFTKIVH